MKAFLQQLSQLWKQLGLNQRVTISVATVGVVAGLIGLVVWSHRPNMQLLYGKLTEKDAAEVAAAVQAAGVQYELRGSGSAIYVPSDQVHSLRLTLAGKGVPAGEGVGFEIFDRANFGISDFVQRTNYARALQGELSRTISQLQGVSSARVLIVVPENRLLFSDVKAKPTASVFIEGNISGSSVNSVRFLVANAVEGLRADDVAVIDHRGNVLTDGLKDDPQLGTASSQMKLRKSVEDYFANKVESMLATVLGPGTAVVRVSADLDVESTTRTEEKYDPEAQVIRTETSEEDSTLTNEVDKSQGGTAGTAANVPGQVSSESAGKNGTGKNSEQIRKSKSLNYEINRVVTNAVRAPGTVSRVSAAVFVAAKAQPRTPAELDSLRKMVVNALGVKATDEKELAKVVTLEEVAFESTPAEKAGALDFLTKNPDLLKHGLAVVVALALVVLFLRMVKTAKPDEIPIEILSPERAAAAAEGAPGRPVSVELLNEMIRQKPNNVGAALREWMAGAGPN
jgi:flagellar M-ring protein FliF